jgi:hypothetical protein
MLTATKRALCNATGYCLAFCIQSLPLQNRHLGELLTTIPPDAERNGANRQGLLSLKKVIGQASVSANAVAHFRLRQARP